MTDHPYTREAVERWQQGKINIFDALAELEGRLEAMKKQERELTAQLFQKVGQMSTIAEDCDGWLNNQCYETACEFIKAVRDYAKKAISDA